VPTALAHAADGAPTSSAATSNPATLVQLESVRRATARFLDVQTAIDEGYVDISVFYSNMGHHYLKPELLDDKFELEKPEILVYADDPCSGVASPGRRRVRGASGARQGRGASRIRGSDDAWTINQQFQLWTLHAWLFEYNPAGVFAAYNVRVP
jgi:hypothetical protein